MRKLERAAQEMRLPIWYGPESAEVTLVDSGPRLLPFADAEISDLLAATFRGVGMRIVHDAGRATATRTPDGLRVELASGKLAPSDPGKQKDTRVAGLIGTAQKNGQPTGIAYRYPHGKVFPPALIREQFHDGEQELPSVRIELLGYVEVREETTLDIYHAAGGVNRDHGTLFIDGDELANGIAIHATETPNEVLLIPVPAVAGDVTYLNDQTGHLTFEFTEDIVIRMGAGNDGVELNNVYVPRDLTIDTGDGLDRISIGSVIGPQGRAVAGPDC